MPRGAPHCARRVETWRHPALDWKWEVHVSGLKRGSSGKKPYDRPSYTMKSISEAGTLVRKKIADQGHAQGAGGASTIGGLPIFLVEGYEGELGFIGETIRTPTRQLAPFSILKGAAMVEMQFADGQEKAAPETFFLWDLRQRRNGERGLLESIGGIPDLGDGLFSLRLSKCRSWVIAAIRATVATQPSSSAIKSIREYRGCIGNESMRCPRPVISVSAI